MKQFDIYKAQEDYLNLNLEEPIDIGDFVIIIIYVATVTSESNSMRTITRYFLYSRTTDIPSLHNRKSEIDIYY